VSTNSVTHAESHFDFELKLPPYILPLLLLLTLPWWWVGVVQLSGADQRRFLVAGHGRAGAMQRSFAVHSDCSLFTNSTHRLSLFLLSLCDPAHSTLHCALHSVCLPRRCF